MGQDQADLRSVSGLERLSEKLKAAPAAIEACLRETEESLLPRLRGLEHAVEQARDALRRAERALEAAQQEASYSDRDDGDNGRAALAAAETSVEDARERLERIENAVAEVRQALGRYKAVASDLSAAKSGVLAQGAVYLSERVHAAHDYLSVRSANGSGADSGPNGVRSSNASDGNALATKVAETVFFLGTVATQISGVAYDIAMLNDETRQNHRLDPQTEQLMEMLDQADGVSFALETEDRGRKRQIEIALRDDASPQVTLFDPTLGAKGSAF